MELVRITHRIAIAISVPIIIRAITRGLTLIDLTRITRSHIMRRPMLRRLIIRSPIILDPITKTNSILNTIVPIASMRGRFILIPGKV